MGGVCVAGDLASADQEIPDQFFKMPFLGGAESTVRLGSKSWFAGVGVNTSNSILDLFFLFNTHIK